MGGNGEDVPRINFDRIAHCYDETRTLPFSQMEAVMGPLVRALSSYRRVLEVGVGTGRFAIPLQRAGIPLIGVDISARMVARGREKGLREVFFADALHLPFQDQSLDAALSIHVLHLLPDWRPALAEVGRVTRKSYYTVATDRKSRPSPFRVYWDYLRDAGCKRPRRGVFERDLPERLPPQERTLIGTFSETKVTSDVIQVLADRIYSGQWETPEKLHREAVEAARRAFPEETLQFEKTLSLLRWDAADLRAN
ncbi:MAG: class I SAM-dependent methyltransferase [Thermoplasmata archaeon]